MTDSSAEIVDFLAAQGSPELSTPNISMIASGKGGVGKTWFSITLAHALAREGRRVLLFDGDFGMANVDIQLGLTPPKDLSYVTKGSEKLTDIIFNYEKGGFDVIAGQSGSGSLAQLSIPRLAALRSGLRDLAKNYDHVLIDLGAGIDGNTRILSPISGHCYVVLTDEPTSLTDAYAFIKVTHSTLPKLPISVVLNQVESQVMADKTYETILRVCETFLMFSPPLLGTIRKDVHVREAIRAQDSILLRFPNSSATHDVELLAKKIIVG